MNTSPSAVSGMPPKADWAALASCFLASSLFLCVFGLFGWLVAGQDQVFRVSDNVHAATGIDLLWLFAHLVVIGVPSALILGGIALYRTRPSRGRKGRILAFIGVFFSLGIIAFVMYLFLASPPLNFTF